MTAGKDALSMFTIDCQRQSHDNSEKVHKERNCTIAILTKKARFDEEEIFQACRRTTQRT